MSAGLETTHSRERAWMRWTLIAAGGYNLAWGVWALAAPNAPFDMLGFARPVWPQIWQCLGMVIGVYGIGYLIASSNPLRHWPIILVGLLGKVFGPIGFVFYAVRGDFPWSFGWVILFNDIIWWIPFGIILLRATKAARLRAIR